MLSTPPQARHHRERPTGSTPGKRTDPAKQAGPEHDGDLAPDELIVCANCGNAVAEQRATISVDGAHEHTFVNPHGIVFKVRCFATTRATTISGAPSSDWSWFPGFAWQIESCSACAEHLGWRFRSPQTQFHGLIADRIVGGSHER